MGFWGNFINNTVAVKAPPLPTFTVLSVTRDATTSGTVSYTTAADPQPVGPVHILVNMVEVATGPVGSASVKVTLPVGLASAGARLYASDGRSYTRVFTV